MPELPYLDFVDRVEQDFPDNPGIVGAQPSSYSAGKSDLMVHTD